MKKPRASSTAKFLVPSFFDANYTSSDAASSGRHFSSWADVSGLFSAGPRNPLEYTKAGDGARLAMLVLHDDAKREYAYGPAQGLPDNKVGTFTQALYDEAKKDGWIVISMKNDWKQIFAFEEK